MKKIIWFLPVVVLFSLGYAANVINTSVSPVNSQNTTVITMSVCPSCNGSTTSTIQPTQSYPATGSGSFGEYSSPGGILAFNSNKNFNTWQIFSTYNVPVSWNVIIPSLFESNISVVPQNGILYPGASQDIQITIISHDPANQSATITACVASADFVHICALKKLEITGTGCLNGCPSTSTTTIGASTTTIQEEIRINGTTSTIQQGNMPAQVPPKSTLPTTTINSQPTSKQEGPTSISPARLIVAGATVVVVLIIIGTILYFQGERNRKHKRGRPRGSLNKN